MLLLLSSLLLSGLVPVGLVPVGLAPLAASPGDPVLVDDFALIDNRGVSHQLSRYADHEAVVLFVQGNGCPIVRQSMPTLRAIQRRFEPRGVAFLLLNPQIQDSLASIRLERQKYELGNFPILRDEAQLVAEGLGVTRTAEAFVIDPETLEILYRGAIDDRLDYETQKDEAQQHFLVDALEATLSGEPVATPTTPPKGCLIFFPARDEHRAKAVSYNEDIVPILARRCVSCHAEGGLAPWAMTEHRTVRGWSRMIREVVMTRRMPPGQIDPEFEPLFEDVHGIPTEERQQLVHWIDAGAVNADESDALREVEPPASGWSYGEPDLILRLPRQEIPATGRLDYIYAPVAVGNTEDLWVRAIQFQPGDPEVLHHLLAFVRLAEDENPVGLESRLLGGYGPGKGAQELPPGTGRLLPAGATIVFSLHYTPSGRATSDETLLGLYLHAEPPPHRLRTQKAANWDFEIPPGVADHPIRAWTPAFATDVRIHSFTPHMHVRGKRMRYSAVLPDESRRVLISIPSFSFDWQMKYTLAEPILLPAGTHLIVDGAFDNSRSNPANPDPEATVRPGLESWFEMFIGYFNYTEVPAEAR